MTSPATDPLVEKVARALCEAHGYDPDIYLWPIDGLPPLLHWQTYSDVAQAIIPIIRDAERDDVVAWFDSRDPNDSLRALLMQIRDCIAANAHRSKP